MEENDKSTPEKSEKEALTTFPEEPKDKSNKSGSIDKTTDLKEENESAKNSK